MQRSDDEPLEKVDLRRVRLPIEQREVTAVLVRSLTPDEDDLEEDDFASVGTSFVIAGSVNEGTLEDQLEWSDFRLAAARTSTIGIASDGNHSVIRKFREPVTLDPAGVDRHDLHCVGDQHPGGIYNSMSQRKHEIAVMRALGANRSKVLMITLMESVTLALLGGLIGWVAGHGLNAFASPFVEARTGVSIGFLDFAPAVPVFSYLAAAGIPISGVDKLEWFQISPELF